MSDGSTSDEDDSSDQDDADEQENGDGEEDGKHTEGAGSKRSRLSNDAKKEKFEVMLSGS